MAPNAFFTPMIEVRSFTDTNMILATLTAPTTIDNKPMNAPTVEKIPKTSSIKASSKVTLLSAKSVSSKGRNLRPLRSIPVNSSSNWSMTIPSFAFTAIVEPKPPKFFTFKNFRADS